MVAERDGLPFVDEHRTTIAATPERVWTALRRYVDSALVPAASRPVALLLGTVPAGGFEVVDEVPGEHLSLAGRHRFSRYQLVFDLVDAGHGQVLTARTYAAFPGPHGRIYRALVIGTRFHVLAVNQMLSMVARDSVSTG